MALARLRGRRLAVPTAGAAPASHRAAPRRSCQLERVELDFDTRTWTLPQAKAKNNRSHEVQLSAAAIEVLNSAPLRALRRLQREQKPKSPFVFTSERGAPFTTAGFARMVERAGSEAKLGFKAHPHMLRHACGYALANRGHDTRAPQAYLGPATSSTRCGIANCHRCRLRILALNDFLGDF